MVVDAVGARAGGDGVFEALLVGPALQVVAVEAVAGRVAHGPHEVVRVLDGARVVEELVKHEQDCLGVRLGAHAEVVCANGGERHLCIGAGQHVSMKSLGRGLCAMQSSTHMILVITAVEVVAIPARWEESLGAHPAARQAAHVRRLTLVGALEAEMSNGLLREA